jgi:hypothetical protein
MPTLQQQIADKLLVEFAKSAEVLAEKTERRRWRRRDGSRNGYTPLQRPCAPLRVASRSGATSTENTECALRRPEDPLALQQQRRLHAGERGSHQRCRALH